MKKLWTYQGFAHDDGRIQRGTGVPDTPGKSQVALGFLTNTGTDLPLRSNWTTLGPIASRGRFVWPSVTENTEL